MYIGGGVTGDIQVNDTHLHHLLKVKYRSKEQELMINKLRLDKNKIPCPERDEMMHMFRDSASEVLSKMDICLALKQNFLLNALDGSKNKNKNQNKKIVSLFY